MFKPRERQDELGLGSRGESKQLCRQGNSMSRALSWEEEDLKGSQPAKSREWRQMDALTNQAVQKLGPRSSLSRHKGIMDFGFDLQRNRKVSKGFRQGA